MCGSLMARSQFSELFMVLFTFDFTPGAETTWHRHDHDYVITAITDLNMRLEEPGNTEREVTVTAGEAYFRNVGVEHNVINVGSEPMSFVEVELK